MNHSGAYADSKDLDQATMLGSGKGVCGGGGGGGGVGGGEWMFTLKF